MTFPRFLRRKVAAQYVRERWGLPCSPNTLAKLAVIGGGPMFRRAGRIPLYATDELDQWVEAKLSKPLRSTCDIREDQRRGAADVSRRSRRSGQ
jgi:hypothetical protein